MGRLDELVQECQPIAIVNSAVTQHPKRVHLLNDCRAVPALPPTIVCHGAPRMAQSVERGKHSLAEGDQSAHDVPLCSCDTYELARFAAAACAEGYYHPVLRLDA